MKLPAGSPFNSHSLIGFLVCFVLLCAPLSAQRFSSGTLVMPKTKDTAWQIPVGEDWMDIEPSGIWLPWKINRIEGNRVYFRMNGEDVSCLARKVVPLTDAVEFFQQKLTETPDDAWMLKSLGQTLSEMGKQELALKYFDKAFAADPEDLSCMSWKGHSLWQLDRMNEAENCFRQVAGSDEYEAEMRMYRGLAYMNQDNYQKALEELEKSQLKTPMALRLKGDCLAATGKPELAVESFNAWVKMEELDPMAYYKRGLFFLREGELDSALADVSTSLRLRSDYANANMLRGAIFERKGQYELALMDFDEALALEPKRIAFHEKRYEVLADLQRWQEAIEGVSKRLELDESYDWGYFQRSAFYSELENYPAAIADVTKAIKMDSQYADYFMHRAKYHSYNRQTKECMEDYDQAIALEPNNPKYYFERGRVRVRLGRYESGLDDLDKAGEKMEGELGLHYYRGMAYLEIGQYDQALADLEKCRQIDSDNPYVVREYVWILATNPNGNERDARRALRWMTRAMAQPVVEEYETGPEWTEPQFHSIMAAALAANGKFDEAVASQEKAISLLGEDDDEAEDYAMRLELYKNKKPYVYDGGTWFEDN